MSECHKKLSLEKAEVRFDRMKDKDVHKNNKMRSYAPIEKPDPDIRTCVPIMHLHGLLCIQTSLTNPDVHSSEHPLTYVVVWRMSATTCVFVMHPHGFLCIKTSLTNQDVHSSGRPLPIVVLRLSQNAHFSLKIMKNSNAQHSTTFLTIQVCPKEGIIVNIPSRECLNFCKQAYTRTSRLLTQKHIRIFLTI